MTTVADVFEKCCRDSGVAYKKVRADHAQLSQKVYGSGGPAGICCALSMLWIARYLKDKSTDHDLRGSFGELVQELNTEISLKESIGRWFGSLLNDNSRIENLLERQNKLKNSLKNTQDKEALRGKLMKELNVSLDSGAITGDQYLKDIDDLHREYYWKKIFDEALKAYGIHNTKFIDGGSKSHLGWSLQDAVPPFDNAKSFLTKNSCVSLIKAHTHFVAAISDHGRAATKSRSGTEYQDGKFKFLDVNGGIAVTGEVDKFQSFLSSYFQSRAFDLYLYNNKILFLASAHV